jgi:glycosyltransferase involved in cell wall biosynthesis
MGASDVGEARRKAEHKPLISVLIPERGRPEKLERLICSLLSATYSNQIEILVQIDDDDEAWKDRTPFEHSFTRYLRRPRAPTLGEKLNQLANEAKGDLLLFLSNDMQMDTPGWPAKCREAAKKLPNGIGIAYVRDNQLHPGHAAYWMMTRRMFEGAGFFAPPWFPYWFVDTWWDEIGTLTGIKIEIDADVSPQEPGRGDTIGGRPDLGFWARFFEDTRPLRLRDAAQMMQAAFGQEPPQSLPLLIEREKMCVAATAHLHTPAFQNRWGTQETKLTPAYVEAKAIAEKMREDIRAAVPRKPRVAICIPSGRSWEAGTGTSVAALAAYSGMAGIDVAVLNVQSSMVSQGRNSSVEIALGNGCDYLLWIDSDMKFPPDALVRLMRHGKEICGATYNKRVPPYETLGKFAGEMKDLSGGGLHEAVLMPGGMMLIKADVYKKLSYPWYFEGYIWPGSNGRERLWGMMKEMFWQVPPDAVSASLDGTLFASWISDNYILGEFGEDCKILSEDLAFCRKARRAGYALWCDLDLTWEMIHIGVLEVPCAKPPPKLVEVAEAAD